MTQKLKQLRSRQNLGASVPILNTKFGCPDAYIDLQTVSMNFFCFWNQPISFISMLSCWSLGSTILYGGQGNSASLLPILLKFFFSLFLTLISTLFNYFSSKIPIKHINTHEILKMTRIIANKYRKLIEKYTKLCTHHYP